MKVLRYLALALAIAIPGVALADNAASSCCGGPCCPHCPHCPHAG